MLDLKQGCLSSRFLIYILRHSFSTQLAKKYLEMHLTGLNVKSLARISLKDLRKGRNKKYKIVMSTINIRYDIHSAQRFFINYYSAYTLLWSNMYFYIFSSLAYVLEMLTSWLILYFASTFSKWIQTIIKQFVISWRL